VLQTKVLWRYVTVPNPNVLNAKVPNPNVQNAKVPTRQIVDPIKVPTPQIVDPIKVLTNHIVDVTGLSFFSDQHALRHCFGVRLGVMVYELLG
jgi:hypothetical protein